MAATYGEKADIVSKIAQRSERMKLFKDAIVHYVRSPPRLAGTCLCTSRHALTNMHTCTQGTYVHCMAVHVYKEDPRNNADVVLSKVNMARRIFTHRNLLEGELQRRDRKYVAPMISVPQQLAPWEWQEWLTMLRSQSIEPLLARFGLVRIESQRSHEMVSDRCAQAGRPCARPMHAARFFLGKDCMSMTSVPPCAAQKMASAMASNVTVNPNINIAGPTINNHNNPNFMVNTGTGNVQGGH
jgi:hypothetical protein